MADRESQAGASSGSQRAETDPNQSSLNPRTAGKTRVNFDQNEEQPQFKVALMTSTAKNLGMGIGQGLAPAAPATEAHVNSKGFDLLVKGMTCRMRQMVGDYNPDERPEDYMKKLMEVNTPVINSAVDWKCTAEKKVRSFFRGTHSKYADPSEVPSNVSLGNIFTQ